VPRVVPELAGAELARVLGDPRPLAHMLRELCDAHGYDGLVRPPARSEKEAVCCLPDSLHAGP